jgi:hypothetical protein
LWHAAKGDVPMPAPQHTVFAPERRLDPDE